MPGITVVQGSPQNIWVPVVAAGTTYVGGIVCTGQNALDEGVKMLPDASGVDDVDNQNVPFGVIIGNNLKVPTYNTTYKCQYMGAPAAADAHDGASKEYYGVEGPWSKGDPVPMVKVSVITPDTVLRAPLYVAAVGTGPTVMTATAGSSTGVQVVASAGQITNVANLGTIYCRTGQNAGCYRIRDDNDDGTSAATWDLAMPKDGAAGDTYVTVPMRPYGHAVIQFESTACTFIDVNDNTAANGDALRAIIVLRLDLRVAKEEYVEFMFDYGQFGAYITRA